MSAGLDAPSLENSGKSRNAKGVTHDAARITCLEIFHGADWRR